MVQRWRKLLVGDLDGDLYTCRAQQQRGLLNLGCCGDRLVPMNDPPSVRKGPSGTFDERLQILLHVPRAPRGRVLRADTFHHDFFEFGTHGFAQLDVDAVPFGAEGCLRQSRTGCLDSAKCAYEPNQHENSRGPNGDADREIDGEPTTVETDPPSADEPTGPDPYNNQ